MTWCSAHSKVSKLDVHTRLQDTDAMLSELPGLRLSVCTLELSELVSLLDGTGDSCAAGC